MEMIVTADSMTLEKYVPTSSVVDKKRKTRSSNVEQFFDMEVDDDANFSLVNVEEYALLHSAPPAKGLAADILPGIKETISDFAAANDGEPRIDVNKVRAGLVYRGENATVIRPMSTQTLDYVVDMVNLRYQNKEIHIPDEDAFGAEEKKGESIEEH